MRPRLDPTWLDAQYNNRARVSDHAQVLASWAQASALARSGAPLAQLDLRYGDGAGETLDVFPASTPGAPVLVFIHGGYWRSLDKGQHSFVAPAFTAAAKPRRWISVVSRFLRRYSAGHPSFVPTSSIQSPLKMSMTSQTPCFFARAMPSASR